MSAQEQPGDRETLTAPAGAQSQTTPVTRVGDA